MTPRGQKIIPRKVIVPHRCTGARNQTAAALQFAAGTAVAAMAAYLAGHIRFDRAGLPQVDAGQRRRSQFVVFRPHVPELGGAAESRGNALRPIPNSCRDH
jgi:hypothetical protein